MSRSSLVQPAVNLDHALNPVSKFAAARSSSPPSSHPILSGSVVNKGSSNVEVLNSPGKLSGFFENNRNRPRGDNEPSLQALYKQQVVYPSTKSNEQALLSSSENVEDVGIGMGERRSSLGNLPAGRRRPPPPGRQPFTSILDTDRLSSFSSTTNTTGNNSYMEATVRGPPVPLFLSSNSTVAPASTSPKLDFLSNPTPLSTRTFQPTATSLAKPSPTTSEVQAEDSFDPSPSSKKPTLPIPAFLLSNPAPAGGAPSPSSSSTTADAAGGGITTSLALTSKPPKLDFLSSITPQKAAGETSNSTFPSPDTLKRPRQLVTMKSSASDFDSDIIKKFSKREAAPLTLVEVVKDSIQPEPKQAETTTTTATSSNSFRKEGRGDVPYAEYSTPVVRVTPPSSLKRPSITKKGPEEVPKIQSAVAAYESLEITTGKKSINREIPHEPVFAGKQVVLQTRQNTSQNPVEPAREHSQPSKTTSSPLKKTNSYAEIAAKTYAAKAVKEVNSKLNILTKAKKVVNSSKKKAESTKLNISTPSLDSIVSEFEKYDEKEDIDADEMVVRDRVGRLHEEEELKQASQLDKHQRKVPQRQTANETPSKTLAANDVAATAQLSQQMVKVSTNKDRSDGKRPPSTNTNVNISIELPADLLDKGHNYKQHRDKKITRRSRHYRRRSHKRGGGHRRDVLDNDDDNDSDTSPSSSSSLQSASPSSSPFSLDNRGRPKRSHSSSSRRHAQRHYSYSHKLDKRSSSRSHHHHHRRHQFDTPPQFFYPLYPNFYPPFLPPPPTSFYQMNYGAGGGDYYDHHYHPHHQSGRHHHRNPYEDYEQNIRSLYTNRSGDEHGYKSEWIKSAASGGRHRGHSRRKSAVASTNTSMDTLDDDNDGTESRSSSTQYNSNESMRRMVGSSESRMCKKCGIRSIKWRASDESINSSKPNSLCSLCDLPSDSSDISSNDSITTQSDFSDWDRRASDRYRSKLDDKKRRISTTESTTPSLIPRLKGRSQLKKKGLVGSGKSMSTAKSAPVPASSTLTKKSIAAVSTRPSLNTTAEMKQHRLQPVKPVAATATKTTSKTTPKSTLIKSKSTGNTSSLKPTAKSATLTTLKKDDVRSRSAPAFKAKPAPNLAKAIVYSAADSASTTNATKSALERRREFSKSVQAATKTKSAAIVKAPSKSNATNQNLPRSRAPTNSNKVGSKSAFALPPKTNNNSRSRTSSIKSTSSAPLVKTGGGPMLVKKNWSSDAAVSAKKSTTSAKNAQETPSHPPSSPPSETTQRGDDSENSAATAAAADAALKLDLILDSAASSMEDLPSAQKQQHISTKMDLGSRKSSTVAAKSSTNDSMLPHKASILTSGNSSKMLSASTVGNHRKGSLTPSDRKATSAAAAGLVSSSSGVAPSSRNRRPSDRRMSLSRLKVESSAASEKTAYSALLSPPASPDNDPLLDAPLPRRKSVYEPVHPPNPSGLAAAAAARKNSAPSLLRDTNRSSRNTSAASSIRSVAASLHNKDRSSKKGGADAAADEEVHKSSTSSHSRRLSEASGLTRRNAINRSNLSSGIRQKLSDPNLSKRRGSSNQLWSSMNSVSSSNSSLHQERKVRTLERINQALKHKKRHSRKRTDSDSKATSERGSERGVGEGGGAAAKEHQPDVEHAQSLKAIVAKSSKTSTALEVPTSKKIGLKNLDSFEELLSDLYPGDAAEEEKSKGKSNVVKKEEVEEEKRKNTVSKEPRIPSTATLKTSSTPALDDLPVPAILSASNPQLSRSNPDMPTDEPPPDASFNMAPCPICERTFKEDRLASHQKICNKVTKKAEVRAAKRESKEAAEEKKKKAESKGKKKDYEIVKTNNWRAKHEDFINSIREAKKYEQEKASKN